MISRSYLNKKRGLGLTKMSYTTPAMVLVRPRLQLPSQGKPVIFVCEGVQCDRTTGDSESLLCCLRKSSSLQRQEVTVFDFGMFLGKLLLCEIAPCIYFSFDLLV